MNSENQKLYNSVIYQYLDIFWFRRIHSKFVTWFMALFASNLIWSIIIRLEFCSIVSIAPNWSFIAFVHTWPKLHYMVDLRHNNFINGFFQEIAKHKMSGLKRKYDTPPNPIWYFIVFEYIFRPTCLLNVSLFTCTTKHTQTNKNC